METHTMSWVGVGAKKISNKRYFFINGKMIKNGTIE